MSGAAAELDRALIAECRAVMARHARSFDRAAAFLPRATRDRVAVLYAFCRAVDDAVDEAPDAANAEAAVSRLHAELRAATEAAPPDARAADVSPVVAAFAGTIGGSPTVVAAAHALCEGVASDVRPARVADDRELLRYCYHVAGAVGVLICPTLGVTDPRAVPFAIDLGVAMQLTNICRDVLEDAGRDRVYLPATRLAAVGESHATLLAGTARRDAVAAVVLELLALADRYYASAVIGERMIPLVPRQAVIVARALYAAIGHELRRRGGDALAGRTIVSPAAKPGLMVRGLLEGARVALAGGPLPPHDATLHAELAGLPGVDA